MPVTQPLITPASLISQDDFTLIDLDASNPDGIVNNPSFIITPGSNVAFAPADENTPAGVWAVNGSKVTAGTLTMAKFYAGYTGIESTIATHLSALSINTKFANAASKFAIAIKAAAADNKTYADLVTLAGNHITGLNMTAQEFVTLVLPNESAGTTYNYTTFTAAGATVDQFANSKITDNSVLQQKLTTATASRNAVLEAMTALMRSWQAFLLGLNKGI